MKFQVGDKVKVVKDNYSNQFPLRTHDMLIGYTGEITGYYTDENQYEVDCMWLFDEDELELIHSKPTDTCGDCMGFPGCDSGCTKVNRSNQHTSVDLHTEKPLDNPVSEPQFSVGDFVINSGNDIGRIEDVLHGSRKIAYEVTFNLQTTKVVAADKLRLVR